MIGFFTVAKLIPLTLLVIAGLTFAGASGNAALELVPSGSGDFLGVVLLIIFAYGDFEGATIPAGEMRNPRRTISVAVLGTLASVVLFYMLIQYAALRIELEMAGTETPMASAGEAMFAGGLAIMTVGALLSIFRTQSGLALISPLYYPGRRHRPVRAAAHPAAPRQPAGHALSVGLVLFAISRYGTSAVRSSRSVE